MSENSLPARYVIVGTPVCRRTSFVLDKFLSNQQEIQQAYPGCRLVLATDEPDFAAELRQQTGRYRLKGEVITYETVKPGYARSRLWSIACGREAIRQYALSQGAEYLLFLDSDMVYEASVINTLLKEIQGYDMVVSGYANRNIGDICLEGLGCSMFKRGILYKAKFRCIEFRNGQVLHEDFLHYCDLARCGAKIKLGVFATTSHYHSPDEAVTITPQPLSLRRRITKQPLPVVYSLYTLSVLFRLDIGNMLRLLIYKFGREK
jgi:hypothetical protein